MSEEIKLTVNDVKNLINISRKGIIVSFSLLIIMLFHVLIDFFYHT
ncbi:MAG: hypothetical protein OEY49_18995 [Candidatus Heimdallarchaeota archaeon]|nr:hypothetical protein [Candidatus Heimdallarchaeota archaeon]